MSDGVDSRDAGRGNGVATSADAVLTALAAVLCALPMVRPVLLALSDPMRIQDDARQFQFWMQRWHDPALFQNDFIAAYFEAVTPLGYTALFRTVHEIGIGPLAFGSVLPLILAGLAGGLGFTVVRWFDGGRMAALFGALLLGLCLGLNADIASATPRAFAPIVLLTALLALARGSAIGLGLSAAIGALFYVQAALIVTALAPLLLLSGGRHAALTLETSRPALLRVLAVWLAGGAALLVFKLGAADFGPVIDAATARDLPTFNAGGRADFFAGAGHWVWWLCGGRAGLFGHWCGYAGHLSGLGAMIGLVFLVAFFGLPALAFGLRLRAAPVFAGLAVVALILFLAAHAVLFDLHLPNRYTRSPSMVLIPLLLALCAESLLGRLRFSRRAALAGSAAGLAGLSVVAAWPVSGYPNGEYVHAGGAAPMLAEIRGMPPDRTVVSLERAADFIPALAGRSVFVAREYFIPYSTGYAAQFRARMAQAAAALYGPEPDRLRGFLADFPDAGYFLIGRDWPRIDPNAWWRAEIPVETRPRRSVAPALYAHAEACAIFAADRLVLIDAACVRAGLANGGRDREAARAAR